VVNLGDFMDNTSTKWQCLHGVHCFCLSSSSSSCSVSFYVCKNLLYRPSSMKQSLLQIEPCFLIMTTFLWSRGCLDQGHSVCLPCASVALKAVHHFSMSSSSSLCPMYFYVCKIFLYRPSSLKQPLL
jgi:hypothetical protein